MKYNPAVIGIYSVGLLGGSLGAALKESGFSGRIIGFSSPASIGAALSLCYIDEGYGYDELSTTVNRLDCLFLCSPISAIMQTIKALGSMSLPPGLLITDVGSTKSEIIACAKNVLPPSAHFIGGHPMAGSEKSGVNAADPFLFQNALYILTPSDLTTSQKCAEFAGFLEHFLGCRSIVLDPIDHDCGVALMSHVPHICAVALVNLARRINELRPGTLKLGAGGFRDMTRIASAPYGLWRDILLTNKKAIQSIIEDYISILGEIQLGIENDSLETLFTDAARTRREIPAANKGIINPLSDIYVLAKDQPGIIATISGALASDEINIQDIEVLKVREGEAGTIRMAFESHELALKAIAILSERGFIARERS